MELRKEEFWDCPECGLSVKSTAKVLKKGLVLKREHFCKAFNGKMTLTITYDGQWSSHTVIEAENPKA